MPVIFMGHGSPMNAIEENEFSRTWEELGQTLPKPKSILCVSAHWETSQTAVTAMEAPRMIYDFMGFSKELYAVQYPAPGNPKLAQHVMDHVPNPISPDRKWGLDHGAWSVLCRMFPQADIPVVQLSLATTRDGEFHYNLGKHLHFLRDEGVLIVGSGNIVHNLGRMVWEDTAFGWASEFDSKVKGWIKAENHNPIVKFDYHDPAAALAINSAEHYLPLLYVLGAAEPGDEVNFYNEKVWGGSLSMTCVKFG
jgi:4,5-DOPA dioxygenase extradiol